MQSQNRILVVDDHRPNIELVKAFLEEEYQLDVVTSGAEALEQVARVTPDLILLDIMMPGLDGYDTCRQIRQLKLDHHIPIIMMSAKALPAELQQGYEAGADDYLTKPFGLIALLDKVEYFLPGSSVSQVD